MRITEYERQQAVVSLRKAYADSDKLKVKGNEQQTILRSMRARIKTALSYLKR